MAHGSLSPTHSAGTLPLPSASPREQRQSNVGILRIAIYFPRCAVAQEKLELFDGVSSGKYTIGLGQSYMSFVTDCEDVISLSLTAFSSLMRSTGLSYMDIGRLDVGTETILDKSKSIKTNLMSLFENEGNFEVEGLDTTNACYGSTAALFNAVAWIESSAWDGRYAVVVAADVAVYDEGPARATGGVGAVAMLVGRDAPLRLEPQLRATVMGNSYDFFKPKPSVEYPTVRGSETVDTYVHALQVCYRRYRERAGRFDERLFKISNGADFILFHAPFNKMVKRSLAYLVYEDFLRTAPCSDSFFREVECFRNLSPESAHRDRDAVRAFVALSHDMYEAKCAPAAWLAQQTGNSYTASLYSSLAALVDQVQDELVGKRVLMYAFGSGFAASMFSLQVSHSARHVIVGPPIRERLQKRLIVSPQDYFKTLKERERNYDRQGYSPKSNISDLFPGTFYLLEVCLDGERKYAQTPNR